MVMDMKKISLVWLVLLGVLSANLAIGLGPTTNLTDRRVITLPESTGFSFESISARDSFFSISENLARLKNGIPITVNEGDAVTTFVWKGIDDPPTYVGALFREQALNSGPGTLFLGIDGANLSSAAKTLNFNSAFGDKAIPHGQAFTDDGSTGPTHFRFTKINDFVGADVFDTQLASPNQWPFIGTTFNSYTEGVTIRPATSGTLVMKAYAGNADTFPIVIDTTFDILPGDVGNLRALPFPNGLLAVAGDDQLIVVSGVDLFGGLQTNPILPFFNQTVGYLRSDTFILTVSDIMTRNQLDDYVLLNSQYNTSVEKSGGLRVITFPTTTVDTVAAAEFIAGIASTSNPMVTTIGSGTFAQGDFVQYLSDPGQPNANDDVYEVHSHVGNTLQMRGIGLNPTVEDDTQDQFVNLVSSGTLTKINISILKATSTGFEFGFGNTTPISFTILGQVDSVVGGTNINISGTVADPVVNLDDTVTGSGTNGLLTLRGAQGGSIGGAVNISGGFGLTTAGRVNITAGSTNSIGENVFIRGGDGPTGQSGGVFLLGGASGDDNGLGGDITLTGGQGGVVTGKGGDIAITGGDSEGSSQAPGNVSISGGERIGFAERGDLILQDNGGSVGVGTSSPDSSSILDLVSTTKGFLPPVLSDTQRDAIATPADGLSIHSSTVSVPQFFNGTAWKKVVFTPTNTLSIIGSIPFVINPGEIEADTNLHWDNVNKRLGIGTESPNASFDLTADSPGIVGGFSSGALHVTSPSALVNANGVITGHNSFGGNKQLWYLGSTSSSNDDIAFINRQNADLSWHTNNLERLRISSVGVFSTPGDFDLTTGTGGVFKLNSNAFLAGSDGSNQLEVGHGGSHSFINNTGAGNIELRWGGVTEAQFTSVGHLHLLTSVDQKHTLKFKTADNLNDTGVAWENSGGNFTGTIFRTNIGSNRADLVFAVGSNADIDLLTEAIRIDGSVAANGDLNFSTYPNTRDDGTPVNILSTDASGNLISSPNEAITLNQDALGVIAGSINYDSVKGTMNIRNIFPSSSIQVGQESVVFVVNKTGLTIPDGKVINISGYNVASDAMEISLALADKIKDTAVLGMTTTTMVDGAVGLVTVFGRVNDLDTTVFAEGDIVYLSEITPGELTATRPAIPIQIGHVGEVNALTGFIQVQIRELEKSIFGGYSHSLDQTFTANVSKPINFDTNDEFSGIEHSTTVNNDEFTFTSGGVYQSTAEPQYTRTTGGGTDVLNIFLAKDTGSGFVNVPRTNVKFAVNTAGATLVSPLTTTFRVTAGDKIRFMAQVESANLILDAFPASGVAPNDIPETPSIIMNLTRIGD